MAIMYPSSAKAAEANSDEDMVFKVLQDNLTDDYHVFHSVRFTLVKDRQNVTRQLDFLIFHKKLGFLYLEVKNGHPKFEDNKWKAGNGMDMHGGNGPYVQANSGSSDFRTFLSQERDRIGFNVSQPGKCAFHYGVWFLKIADDDLANVATFGTMPPDVVPEYTLTTESLSKARTRQDVDRAFTSNIQGRKFQTDLSDEEADNLLNRLRGNFHIVSLSKARANGENARFAFLLDEQYHLLDYLENQPNAVIAGMAGTGKTVLAVEKARRHSVEGDNVLFICYNSMLREQLEEDNKQNQDFRKVDFRTLDKLVYDWCGINPKDFRKYKALDVYLRERRDLMLAAEPEEMGSVFPYKHIIIDEGQDFGKDEINAQTEIMELLNDLTSLQDGTFYVFYDGNQLVQAQKVPDIIERADCKLTLWQNCRNTVKIARTSINLLTDDHFVQRKVRSREGIPSGRPVQLYIEPDESSFRRKLQNVVDRLTADDGIKSVQILTCVTEENSAAKSLMKPNPKNIFRLCYAKHPNVGFTTCRKFKGLEADAVVLIDIGAKNLIDEFDKYREVYYEGASRAKHRLVIIMQLSEAEKEVFVKQRKLQPKGRRKREPDQLIKGWMKIDK